MESTAKNMLKELNKEESTEDCVPCKVNVAIGVMVGQYCKEPDSCEDAVNEVLEGKKSLRELADKLSVEDFVLDELEENGVPLDEKQEWGKLLEKEQGKENAFVAQVNAINEQYQKEIKEKEGGEQ